MMCFNHTSICPLLIQLECRPSQGTESTGDEGEVKTELGWVFQLLNEAPRHVDLRFAIYDAKCTAYRDVHLAKLSTDSRVEVFEKHQRSTLWVAYFDFIVKKYDNLPDFTVFCHGDNVAWHRHHTMSSVVDLLMRLVTAGKMPDYVSLGEQVETDWLADVEG